MRQVVGRPILPVTARWGMLAMQRQDWLVDEAGMNPQYLRATDINHHRHDVVFVYTCDFPYFFDNLHGLSYQESRKLL